MTAYTVEPTLTNAEMALLVQEAKIADSFGIAPDTYLDWAPATALALGVQVCPTVRSGHFYTVTVAGTTGAIEPVWPTTSGGVVVNGTATFTESGAADWTPTWDLNGAAMDGWQWKAAKVSAMMTFTADMNVFEQEQLIANCLKMAKVYQSLIIRNVQLGGGLTHTLGATVGN